MGSSRKEVRRRRWLFELAWLAGVLLTGSRAGRADVDPGPLSATVTAASDYVFRGFSQTQGAPALQAGVDYTAPFGLVAGVWASTVDLIAEGAPPDGADVEVDLYLTHGWKLGERVALDATLIRYVYPGTLPGIDYDYNELVLALHPGDVATLTIAYSNDAFASGEPALLYELAASYPLPGGLELSTRLGLYDLERAFGASYAYYAAGVSRDFGRFTLDARYESANSAGRHLWGDAADGRIVAQITANF